MGRSHSALSQHQKSSSSQLVEVRRSKSKVRTYLKKCKDALIGGSSSSSSHGHADDILACPITHHEAVSQCGATSSWYLDEIDDSFVKGDGEGGSAAVEDEESKQVDKLLNQNETDEIIGEKTTDKEITKLQQHEDDKDAADTISFKANDNNLVEEENSLYIHNEINHENNEEESSLVPTISCISGSHDIEVSPIFVSLIFFLHIMNY